MSTQGSHSCLRGMDAARHARGFHPEGMREEGWGWVGWVGMKRVQAAEHVESGGHGNAAAAFGRAYSNAAIPLKQLMLHAQSAVWGAPG